MYVTAIPSPTTGVWMLGPVPVRAYALCIIAAILVGAWLTRRRYRATGGNPDVVTDVLLWGIPFGIVGARLYHVATNPELYFADGRDPWRALFVWEGGLGIWGAIALGAVGVHIGARRHGIDYRLLADVFAPGIALAQVVGRWGNWFNQELFGRPTSLPWGLSIDPDNRPTAYATSPTFHPTFLYESLWNLVLVAVLLWAERRFRLTNGRLFALYVMGYTAGRAWIEYLRVDPANYLLGLRVNDWTSLVLFAAALTYFVLAGRRGRPHAAPQDLTTPSPSEKATTHVAITGFPADTVDDPTGSHR